MNAIRRSSKPASVLLALEALENYPYTPQAYYALIRAVNSSRLSLTINAHKALLTSHFTLSNDGSRLITSAQDGTVKVFDITTGEELLKIAIDLDITQFVRWSPDESKILFVGYYGKAGWVDEDANTLVAIWDAKTGEKILELPAGEDWFACWSPSGTRVITSAGSNQITIWDAATGEKLKVLDKHTGIARVAPNYSWSPDGIHFVSSSNDGTAIIWNLETGEDVFTLVGPESGIAKAKYSYNGDYVATIDSDRKLIIWDAQTGEQVFVHIPELTSPEILEDIYWSPTSNDLAVKTYGPNSYILDAETGQVVQTFPGHTVTTYVSWSPLGDRVATSGEDGKVIVWNVASGFQQFTLFGHNSSVAGAGWTKDGRQVISAGMDGTIKIWNTEMAPLTTEGFGMDAFGLTGGGAWSPDSSMYARAYMDGTAIIWDAETGAAVYQIDDLGFAAYVTDWHPDGRLLVNANILGDRILVFDGNSGEELLSFETGHELYFGIIAMDAKFSPDGSMIATAGWDTDVRIFDAYTGNLIQVLGGHLGGVYSVSWSPDNTRIVTGAWDYTAKVWDVATGEVLADLYPEDSNLIVMAVAWAPDGSRIASSAMDGIHIWDLAGEKEPLFLVGHAGDITALDWSSDGNYLLSTGMDGVGKLWDAQTGLEISIYEIGPVTSGFLSPDMTKVAFSSEDGTVRFYPVLPDVDDLIEYAYKCCVVRELSDQERLMFGLDAIE